MAYLNINLTNFTIVIINIVLNVFEKPTEILILKNGIKLFEYFTSILTPKPLRCVYRFSARVSILIQFHREFES